MNWGRYIYLEIVKNSNGRASWNARTGDHYDMYMFYISLVINERTVQFYE